MQFCGVGVNGQTVTIVANPSTSFYTVGDSLMLTCMISPSPLANATVTYSWTCSDCFADGQTTETITRQLTDMDAGPIDCTATINGDDIMTVAPFNLQLQGSYIVVF